MMESDLELKKLEDSSPNDGESDQEDSLGLLQSTTDSSPSLIQTSNFNPHRNSQDQFNLPELSQDNVVIIPWLLFVTIVVLVQYFQIRYLSTQNEIYSKVIGDFSSFKEGISTFEKKLSDHGNFIDILQIKVTSHDKYFADQTDFSSRISSAMASMQSQQLDIGVQIAQQNVKTDNIQHAVSTQFQNLTHDIGMVADMVGYMSDITGLFSVAMRPHESIALHLNVDEISLHNPRSISIREMVQYGARVWSTSTVTLYVGDMVTWTFTDTSENIISCDNNGIIVTNGYLNSGPFSRSVTDGSPHSYTVTFFHTGEYHYRSQNSASLTGKITVKEVPSMSMVRFENKTVLSSRGRRSRDDDADDAYYYYDDDTADDDFDDDDDNEDDHSIPGGVLFDVHLSDVNNIQGCWTKCYDSTFDIGTPNNFLDNCPGEWIFMGTTQDDAVFSTADGGAEVEFILGAFGRKSKIFTTTTPLSKATHDETILGFQYENNLFWYATESKVPR